MTSNSIEQLLGLDRDHPELARPEGWMALGLCGQTDPDAFFPVPGGQNGATGQAKQVCSRCEVSQQCLTFALENDMRYGIWGGKSAYERRRISRLDTDTPPPVSLPAPAFPERLAG